MAIRIKSILIIDDQTDLQSFCVRFLGGEFNFLHVTSGREALRVLRKSKPPDAILLDRDFSNTPTDDLLGPPEDARNEGLHILENLRRARVPSPVIMVTGYRDHRIAVSVARQGADFLAWEDLSRDPGLLRSRISRALASAVSDRDGILAGLAELGALGRSPSYLEALIALRRAVSGTAPVLLQGEPGTGKDTLAYALHSLSGDAGRPFVNVNVAALSEHLIESELFGHRRGAFTGADRDAMGKVRLAEGGTLFLNEIGDLPVGLQVKLLDVVEYKRVRPVGDERECPVEFRLVTATSRDLRAMMDEGEFRSDLFHRLNHHSIHLPPLRERREDIPLLTHHFLRTVGSRIPEGVLGIALEAVEYLCELDWPGNVRELRSVIEAACCNAEGILTVMDIQDVLRPRDRVANGSSQSSDEGRSDFRLDSRESPYAGLTYRQLTAVYLSYLHRQFDGNATAMAQAAGVSRGTIYNWVQQYGRSSRTSSQHTAGPE